MDTDLQEDLKEGSDVEDNDSEDDNNVADENTESNVVREEVDFFIHRQYMDTDQHAFILMSNQEKEHWILTNIENQ